MASSVRSPRFAAPGPDDQRPHGSWWPSSRSLVDQLPHLIQAWPVEKGSISRILYSPPDWDDHPRSVLVVDRHMKTGSFPQDDTHQVTLVLHNGQRRSITVIPPETSTRDAGDQLDAIAEGYPRVEEQNGTPPVAPTVDADAGRVRPPVPAG
jgi:hypothetical protein